LGNMVFLWVFGDNVEDRMGHIGYTLFYLACGLAASGAHLLFNLRSVIPTVGASGAIAGVLGAYLLFYPYHRVNTLVLCFFITVVRVPAIILIGVWALLQVFSGVGSLGVTAQTSGVAYWAHVGGFLAGMGWVAAYRLLRREPVWQPERGR
ncbi:MAG: rhomboid family intramembrane serine protease, partial [Chloroflexi bacterium]|nr:rhomboid family intramembrane serine protease [Chloroflexota bacterium]